MPTSAVSPFAEEGNRRQPGGAAESTHHTMSCIKYFRMILVVFRPFTRPPVHAHHIGLRSGGVGEEVQEPLAEPETDGGELLRLRKTITSAPLSSASSTHLETTVGTQWTTCGRPSACHYGVSCGETRSALSHASPSRSTPIASSLGPRWRSPRRFGCQTWM